MTLSYYVVHFLNNFARIEKRGEYYFRSYAAPTVCSHSVLRVFDHVTCSKASLTSIFYPSQKHTRHQQRNYMYVTCTLSPSHLALVLQRLVRACVPKPHVAEHSDQCDHIDQRGFDSSTLNIMSS